MTDTIHVTTPDLAPLYRNSVGIDRLFEKLINSSQALDKAGNYPPYNIIAINNDEYIIEIAIAGFDEETINITAHNGQLIIKGNKPNDVDVHYVHHGIGGRKFKRVFELAEYVEVQNANIHNGILIINLERIVPESAKPKEIKIGSDVKIDPIMEELNED